MSFRPSVASGEISPEPLQIHFYHSLSVAVAMRCLGNARSCYHRAQPYRRAARHDMGVGLAVRSPASTLRRTGSKSLKHRTREEGAGKGEFAFTECRNFYYSLAQNRGFCAKEEPQAIEQTSRVYSAFCEVSLAATRRAARHDKVGEGRVSAPRAPSEERVANHPSYVPALFWYH